MGSGYGYQPVVTPEGVPLDLDVAGLGSRGIAIMIDLTIQTVGLIALIVVMDGLHLGDAASAVILSIASFMLFFGYFFIFEGLWHGRTPGKRAQGLRAIRTDGQPMSTPQMFVRNIVRIVDFLPAYYVIGSITIVVTRRSQRLGDLAAGTLVIREAKVVTPRPVSFPPPPPVDVGRAPSVDVSAMREVHYQLLRSFFERRDQMEPHARSHLASQIATAIRPVIRTSAPLSDEGVIEAAAAAYRRRFAPQ